MAEELGIDIAVSSVLRWRVYQLDDGVCRGIHRFSTLFALPHVTPRFRELATIPPHCTYYR